MSVTASEITTPRLRGFIYAVVARTIGATYVESEAAQLLADADVPSDVVAGVLDHLHHPSLTADEAAVINYARDSVRYQVPVIQKTLRALAKGKPPQLTVDTVGQVAFANTVARLDILVD